MVERTTDAPRLGQLDRAASGTAVDTVADGTKRHLAALATDSIPDHVERTAERTGSTDSVLRRTLSPGAFDLDIVACTGRDVLDLQGRADRATHLAVRMAGRHGVGVGQDTADAGRATEQRALSVGVLVVSAVNPVSRTGDLEQTPGLIDANVADEVRNVSTRIGGADRSDRGARRTVQDRNYPEPRWWSGH